MQQLPLYPLKFDPIYQYRTWGGRILSDLVPKPLPDRDPIGEAWIMSDRDDRPSKVLNGKLAGQTIKQLMEHSGEQLMGALLGKFDRFPLLLKFLDCQQVLSVQVHPADDLTQYIPEGEHGKTEAWVVLQTGSKARIFAGLKPGTTKALIREKLAKHHVADVLSSFVPKVGDSVLIKAGTVHALGDVVVFEVQENSDITYRLYDWDRKDKKTGKPRDLQVDAALACIDVTKTDIKPVEPVVHPDGPDTCELLLEDEHFSVLRHTGKGAFMVGKENTPRILVGIGGSGDLEHQTNIYTLKRGEVMLLPASVGACPIVPKNNIVLLEVILPEK